MPRFNKREIFFEMADEKYDGWFLCFYFFDLDGNSFIENYPRTGAQILE